MSLKATENKQSHTFLRKWRKIIKYYFYTSDAGSPIGSVHQKQLKWCEMVLADRRWRVYEIMEAMGISHGSVILVLNDQLGKEGYPQDGYSVYS